MLTISNSDAARLGLLIMYAWDMCDQDSRPDCVVVDERIAIDGYDVIGLFVGADDIITSGPQGIRQNRVAAGSLNDLRRYGYAARKRNTEEYIAVIRGTDGAQEWFDDFVFISTKHPPWPGRVESGFVDIYQSMQYVPLDAGGTATDLAAGLVQMIQAAGPGASLRVPARPGPQFGRITRGLPDLRSFDHSWQRPRQRPAVRLPEIGRPRFRRRLWECSG